MKLHFTFLLCFCYSFVFAQTNQYPSTVNGGNNQFGNHNTQNNYSEKRLQKKDTDMIDRFIERQEKDSNFYSIKYFIVALNNNSNAATLKADLDEHFRSKGWIDKGQSIMATYMPSLTKGMVVDLVKKDSCIKLTLGIF